MITVNAVYPVEGSLNRSYLYKANWTNDLAGQVRYNFDLNQMEIFDGTAWQAFKFDIHVGFNKESMEVLNWAREQRAEQKRLQELCKKYPSIADLKEKLDVMVALVKEKEDA